jgi:hypothetical protein
VRRYLVVVVLIVGMLIVMRVLLVGQSSFERD